MGWVRKSDGTRVEVPDVDVWGPPKTKEEIAAKKRAGMPPVTRMQFAIALAVGGIISAQEAKDFSGGNALPALATRAIAASKLNDIEKMVAEIRALGAPNVSRLNPLVLLLQAAVPMSDEEADILFESAAAIE